MATPKGMAGFGDLGSTLIGGNGPNETLAEAQGMSLGANTQAAIVKARGEQQRQDAITQAQDPVYQAKMGYTPEQGMRYANAIAAGRNPTESAEMVAKDRDTEARRAIADPNTSASARFYNAASTDPSLLGHQFENLGDNGIANNVQGTAGATPYSAAATGDKNASAARAYGAAALDNARAVQTKNGPKAPANFEWAVNADGTQKLDPNGQPILTPITGGGKDPNAATSMGSREASYFQRQLIGAKQSVSDLQAATQLPQGATTGVLGIGTATPAHSLMSTVSNNLRNKMSDEDTQMYNASLAGLSRGLASIETAGLSPQGSFTNSMDAYNMRPGDTENTKLFKLASARQVVENGMLLAIGNPRVPAAQKAQAQEILDDVRKAIPFTRADVMTLRGSKPGTSIADVANARMAASKAASDAAPANPALEEALAQYGGKK